MQRGAGREPRHGAVGHATVRTYTIGSVSRRDWEVHTAPHCKCVLMSTRSSAAPDLVLQLQAFARQIQAAALCKRPGSHRTRKVGKLSPSRQGGGGTVRHRARRRRVAVTGAALHTDARPHRDNALCAWNPLGCVGAISSREHLAERKPCRGSLPSSCSAARKIGEPKCQCGRKGGWVRGAWVSGCGGGGGACTHWG